MPTEEITHGRHIQQNDPLDAAGDSLLRAMYGAGARKKRDPIADVQEFIAKITAPYMAPWISRKKHGKSGKLYTLGDIRENVIRKNRAVNDAKAKAARAQIRRENSTQRQQRADLRRVLPGGGIAEPAPWRRTPGIAGDVASGRSPPLGGGPVADHAMEVANAWMDRAIESKRERERVARAARLGRRGALATRPFQPLSSTNRRGALAARRPSVIPSGTVAAAGTRAASSAAKGNSGRSAPVESAESRQARAVMAGTTNSSQKSTASGSQTSQRSGVLSHIRVQSGMSPLDQLASLARARARTRTRASTQAQQQMPQSRGPAQGLTSLNALGVSSAQQEKHSECNCPKPGKQRKDEKDFPCKNPIISRSVTKDGIITIKRKLQCPPSRPKSP